MPIILDPYKLYRHYTVTVATLDFEHTYEKIQKIFVELNNGLTEVCTNHANLSGTIQTGKLLLFQELDDKIICKNYILDNAVLHVLKKGNLYQLPEILIFGYHIVDINKTSPFSDINLVNKQLEETEDKLNSLFEKYDNPDDPDAMENLDMFMKLRFHECQKEIAFWRKVKAGLSKK
jgi:hypothetical protein